MAVAPFTAALNEVRADLEALSAQVAENEEARAELHDSTVDTINANFAALDARLDALEQVIGMLLADMVEDEAEEGDVDEHFNVTNPAIVQGLARPDRASVRAATARDAEPEAGDPPVAEETWSDIQRMVEAANSTGEEDYGEHRWEDDGGPHRDDA